MPKLWTWQSDKICEDSTAKNAKQLIRLICQNQPKHLGYYKRISYGVSIVRDEMAARAQSAVTQGS